MKIELLEIPGLKESEQSTWKVRALAIDGEAPALKALRDWEESENADYKKIMKVMRIVGQMRRVHDEKKVKKSSNPKHEGAYEMRADKDHARLMFFYSDDAVVVCTNSYWKGKGSQDTAFRHCSELRHFYLSQMK